MIEWDYIIPMQIVSLLAMQLNREVYTRIRISRNTRDDVLQATDSHKETSGIRPVLRTFHGRKEGDYGL